MSQCFQSTDGFIKTLFGPRVAVLCSQDAEIISRRNNLSFAELIRPFCTINNELQVHDPSNQVYLIRDLHVTVCDLRCNIPDENSIEQMLSEVVHDASSSAELYKTENIDSERYQVNVNMSCPWFEAYRETRTSLASQKLHEFINHCLSCLLVVSSSHPNPIEEFSRLSQHQNYLQHTSQQAPIRWMTPNTFKYYVLLHDNSTADIDKARSVMNNLQGMYGMGACHLLRLNSKVNDDDNQLPDPWSRFLRPTVAVNEPNGLIMNDSNIESNLAVNPITVSTEIQPNDSSWVKDLKKVAVVPQKGYGCCLTLTDHDSLRRFMQDFAAAGLIPHMEKLIRNFHEQISSRKALHRSIFRVTKTFFGGGKAASAPALKNFGAGGIESPELQVRKLADLFFLCQMFEHAFSYYHSIRKDFSNEQAWLHAAGASEMAAFSNFMQLRAQRAYPAHYVDTAIDAYLNHSTDHYLAVRCALVSLECLRTQGLYNEAGIQLKKLINETCDLQSAVIWEQIAQCHLRMKKPQLRKFAFYILLAGHRYNKALQHNCALMCYQNALQVYNKTGWNIAVDFINFTIGRLHFQLKHYERAAAAFQQLIKESNQTSSQQAMYLNEYLHVAKFQESTDSDILISVPVIMQNEIVIRNTDFSMHSLRGRTWDFLDEALRYVASKESTAQQSWMPKPKSFIFEAVVNEPLWVDVTLRNPLKVTIALHEISLLFNFQTENNQEAIVDCPSVLKFVLPEVSNKVLSFCVTPHSTGQLQLLGLHYTLSLERITSFSSLTTLADVGLTGQQMFHSPNFNVKITPAMPRMEIMYDGCAAKMLCDEIKKTDLVLANVGQSALKNLKVACDAPNVCLFTKSDFPFANVKQHFLQCASRVSSDICSVQSLCDAELDQGKQLELLLYIHAPPHEGKQTLNLMFYYEPIVSSKTGMKYRSVKYTIDLYTRPSLTIIPSVYHDNSQHGVVVSTEVKNVGLHDRVTCSSVILSSSTWLVSTVADAAAEELQLNQAATLYFEIVDNNFVEGPAKQWQCISLINDARDEKLTSEPSSLPCYLYNGKITTPQQVDYLTIGLQWEANYKESSTVGQHCLHLTDLKSDTMTLEKIGINEDSNLLSESSQSLEALHQLVRWKFIFKKLFEHDFNRSSLCFVPVAVELQNQYNCELVVNINGMDASQLQNIGNQAANTRFLWVAKSLSKFVLAPKQSFVIKMKACFSAPGVYNINSFGVWAVPLCVERNAPMLPQSCNYSCLLTVVDINAS